MIEHRIIIPRITRGSANLVFSYYRSNTLTTSITLVESVLSKFINCCILLLDSIRCSPGLRLISTTNSIKCLLCDTISLIFNCSPLWKLVSSLSSSTLIKHKRALNLILCSRLVTHWRMFLELQVAAFFINLMHQYHIMTKILPSIIVLLEGFIPIN